MFIDKAEIIVKAGDGGDGAVSFRREKYVANGGPDGGDGGDGGSVIFAVDEGMRTLADFKFKRFFRADNGQKGGGTKMHGKSAENLVVKVPLGTVVKTEEDERVLADLSEPQKQRCVARGGKGGKGNYHFATSTRQAPRFAVLGEKTKEFKVILELKTIADVGLVGYPNVGKSTLLSKVSAAKPKIANYHFTTLTPSIGLVRVGEEESFFMADIPGLIEGASEGVGLGFEFLRHVERNRMLIHVVDISGIEGRDPLLDYDAIMFELETYNPALAALPQVVAANKYDMCEDDEVLNKLRAKLEPKGIEVFPISALTGEGLQPLIRRVNELLKELPPVTAYEEEDPDAVLLGQAEEPYTVTQLDTNVFELEGPLVNNLLNRVNFEDYYSLQYFQRMLKEYGMVDSLRKAGAGEGSSVIIDGMEFNFVE